MLFQTGETELSSFERKCYWTTCGNPGWVWRWRGAQAFPKMLALSLIVSLTPFPYDPPSSWKPAMGTRCFACRQSCNCSYQVFHLVREKKLHFIPNPARGLQPSASIWEGSSWISQTVPMPRAWMSPQGWYRNGTGVGGCGCWILLQRQNDILLCMAEREALCFK